MEKSSKIITIEKFDTTKHIENMIDEVIKDKKPFLINYYNILIRISNNHIKNININYEEVIGEIINYEYGKLLDIIDINEFIDYINDTIQDIIVMKHNYNIELNNLYVYDITKNYITFKYYMD